MPCEVRVTDRGLAPVTIETISGLALIGRRTGPLRRLERYTLEWTHELGLRGDLRNKTKIQYIEQDNATIVQ